MHEGYAIWLEPVHLHFHRGDQVKVKVLWGRGMRRSNGRVPGPLRGFAVNPEGNTQLAEIQYDEAISARVLTFNAGEEGIYTVQVENDGPENADVLRRYLAARLPVQVGHHAHGSVIALNRGLEIIADTAAGLHPGREIELAILFAGKPMAGAKIVATYHLYEGDGFPYARITDERGKAKFVFDARGHWMFQVSTKTDGQEHTATLVVPGVK